MNILIYVNYSDSQFNKDFKIANVLLNEHNIFFVINDKQLNDMYDKCDLFFRGLSAKDIDLHKFKHYNLDENTYLDYVEKTKK